MVCQAVTKEGWILPGEVPYGCRVSDKPQDTQQCNYGPCHVPYHWRIAPWGEVRTFIYSLRASTISVKEVLSL